MPDGATIIYDAEDGIGSLADIKAGDIVTVQLPSGRAATGECLSSSTGSLEACGWHIRLASGYPTDATVLRAFRLASVPLPTEGGPHAIRATVRGVEGVLIFGPDEGSDWYSFDPIGRDCWHHPEDIVWDGQAYVGPGEQSSEADR